MRRWVVWAAGVIVAMVVAVVGVVFAIPAVASGGSLIIGASGKCVDVDGASTANGTQVQLWHCHSGVAQQWSVAGDGTIRALGKCLHVSGGSSAAGTAVQLWSCDGGGAQRWAAAGGNALVNPQSGLCLDARWGSTSTGTPLQIWPCNGTDAQRWSPPPGGPAVATSLLPGNLTVRGWYPHPSDHLVEVLRAAPFTLQQGESRRVFGQAYLRSSSDDTWEADAVVDCLDSAGQPVGPVGWAAKNQTNKAGLYFNPQMLFTAPADGTYTCRLNAAGSVDQTALASGTWLMVDTANVVNAKGWQSPYCGTYGQAPTCTYLGGNGTFNGSPNADHAYLLFDDGTLPEVWTAASGIAGADLSASAELTVCYSGTDSCAATEYGGKHVGSTVRSRLEAVQLNAAGGVCNVTSSPAQLDVINASTHHFHIAYHLANVPILAGCGSRSFRVRVAMEWVSGSPVKVDDASAFVVGTDETIAAPVWSGWTAVPGGGATSSAPAAVVFGGMLHVFVRGTDNSIAQNTYNGSSWSGGWTAVPGGGATSSAPTAVVLGGSLHVFVRGTDNSIAQNTYNGSSWSGWSAVPGGGATLDAPGQATFNYGLNVFVRGTDNAIYVDRFGPS